MNSSSYDPPERVQILDKDGNLVEGADPPDLSEEELVQMYREMVFARHFDKRTVSLQRQGRMGTYPPMSGQEGAQVGSAYALDEDDWVFYQYREHAVTFVRGVDPKYILLYWKGHTKGNVGLKEENIFPINVPIASQIPHAVGMAWSSQIKNNSNRAYVCHFGDGATSEGDFHEGMNFAGVFNTPNVFFCNNNQWAISVPREKQTASQSFAQKAIAYGFDGIQVDGMDPLAVYKVSKEALDKARQDDPETTRPTLIETVLYRFGAHTTADDPSVYRDEDKVEQWKERDPITRMESFLLDTGYLTEKKIDTIEREVEEQTADAIDAAESTPDPDPDEMFDHVYANTPTRLQEQKEYLNRLRERHGDDVLLQE